jgi:hypothetical protein
MSIENNEKCTYIIPTLSFSLSDAYAINVAKNNSYCNITMYDMQGILLPKGLSTFKSNNILYFKNDTDSIKTLRLGFNISNNTKAVGKRGFPAGSCFRLTGQMRLNAYYNYNGSTTINVFKTSPVTYICAGTDCPNSSPSCEVFKTVYINNDPLVPIILQPRNSVGFSVDFYCDDWGGGVGFGGIDFYNNVGYLSSFNVSFLTFE